MISTYRAHIGGHDVECRQKYPGFNAVSVDGLTVAGEYDDQEAFRLYDMVKCALSIAFGEFGARELEDVTEAGSDGKPVLSMSLDRERGMYTVTAKTFYADKREAEHAFRAMSVSLREV